MKEEETEYAVTVCEYVLDGEQQYQISRAIVAKSATDDDIRNGAVQFVLKKHKLNQVMARIAVRRFDTEEASQEFFDALPGDPESIHAGKQLH